MDKSVLVVDDEAHIRRVLSLQLSKAGYAVESAADGQEALAMIRERTYDLVITDHQMPILNGLELCAALESDESTRSIPVLLLTANGYSVDETFLRSQRNVIDLLCKPFSPKELVQTVEQTLLRHEERL